MSNSKIINENRISFYSILIGILFIIPILILLSPQTAFGVVLFSLILIAFWYYPEYTILTVIVLRPTIDVLREDYEITLFNCLTFSLYTIFALLILVLISLYLLFIAKKKVSYKHNVLAKVLSICLLVFFIINIVSFIRSSQKLDVLREMIQVACLISAALFGYIAIQTKRISLSTVKNFVLVSLVFPVLASFWQLATGGISSRVQATFIHPNKAGEFFAIALIVYIITILHQKRISVFDILVVSTTFILLIFTQSRTALFSFLTFAVLSLGTKYYKLFIITGLLFIISIFSIEFLYERFYEDLVHPATVTNSYAWREELWADMKPKMLERPFFGYGLGTSEEVCKSVRGFYKGSCYAHSDYYLMILETGTIGLALYMSLYLLFTLYFGLKFFQEKNKKRYTYLAISAIGIAIPVLGYALAPFMNRPAMGILWLFLGMIVALESADSTDQSIKQKNNFRKNLAKYCQPNLAKILDKGSI